MEPVCIAAGSNGEKPHFDKCGFFALYPSYSRSPYLDRDRMTLYRPFTYLDKLRWVDPSSTRAQAYLGNLAQMI